MTTTQRSNHSPALLAPAQARAWRHHTDTTPVVLPMPPARDHAVAPAPAGSRQRGAVVAAMVSLVVVVAVLVSAVGVATNAVASGDPQNDAPGAEAAASVVTETREYIVQPGDTLWSIATELDAGGDIRSVVDQLEDLTDGAALYPGQRPELPLTT